jgi:hypothetical protein
MSRAREVEPPRPDRSSRAAFRRAYGAEPLHLLVALATLAFAGYGVVTAVVRPDRVAFLLWFGGAVVAHDLVLFWAYTGVRRGLERAGARLARGDPGRAVRAVNHVTVPLFVSALLLVVWFPLIFGLSAPVYERKVGLPPDPGLYLARWLLVTAALFSASAVLYLVRLRRRA